MRRALLTLFVCLPLVACGGATPTLAPYTGAKLHGYPTPGEIASTNDSGGGVTLLVRGEVKDIVALYTDSWRADGWTPGRHREKDTIVTLPVTLHGRYSLELLFYPYTGILLAGGAHGTMVHIPPFERYDWQ